MKFLKEDVSDKIEEARWAMIKSFIKNNADSLNANKFDELYAKLAGAENKNFRIVPYFTEVLLKVDIDPLLFTNKVPNFYLFNSTSKRDIKLGSNIKSIGRHSFAQCYWLENIKLPDSVELIEYGAFYGDKALENIEWSSSLKRIDDQAFTNCSFTSITLPEGLEEIGTMAFMACTKLKYLFIPKSVQLIESDAFYECNSLEIEYEGTEEDWNKLNINRVAGRRTVTCLGR